jgi:pectate lyase
MNINRLCNLLREIFKMIRLLSFSAYFVALGCAADLACAQGNLLPAFRGAEGFGAIAKGGRGGRVIKVINLNPAGLGSLQAACAEQGPRTIVFDVSGVIEGDVTIEHGDVSILGQTAPGAGITIAGSLKTRYRARQPINDLVIRFLRVRPLDARGASGDAIQLSENKRVILDHVSCAWAADETIDIFGAQDVTIQWCTVEESLVTGHPEGRHNYGLISGPEGAHVSIHHTLFAHHARRCPAVANGPADVRNNVVYDFRDGFGHDNRPNDGGYNVIGNYYKRGPSDAKIFPFCFRDMVAYYLRDNYIDGVGIVQDPWAEADKLEGLRYYAGKGRKATEEVATPKVTTHTPTEGYRLVLQQAGGLPRDAVTRRIVEDVQTGGGSWGRKPQDDLLEGLTVGTAPSDTDGDAMPDDWEAAHGLNGKDGSDHGKAMPSGYTAIEEYANELAAKLIAAAEAGMP